MWKILIPILVIFSVLYFVASNPKKQSYPKLLTPAPSSTLEITSDVDGQIEIDNHVVGEIRARQPQQFTNLEPGLHLVSISNPKYSLESGMMTLVENQVYKRDFYLKPEPNIIPKAQTVAFNDLENAINNANNGARLFLAAGEYHISKSIEIHKPISLIGAGKSKTRVISSAEGSVLNFHNNILRLRSIGFEHIGTKPADVIVIQDASFSIEDCRFAGGYTSDLKSFGNGFKILKNAGGTILKSLFEKNALNGLDLKADTSASIENNAFLNNGFAGISLSGTSHIKSFYAIFRSNGVHGIKLSDNASVYFDTNKIESELKNGISILDSAKGEFLRNTFRQNAIGVLLRTQSEVSIMKNSFTDNKMGIFVSRKSRSKTKLSENKFRNGEYSIFRER